MAERHGSIIVLGLLGQFPIAGMAWQLVHHLVGFQRLGFDVYYIEETGAPPYDPRVKSSTDDCSYSVQMIADTLARFGFGHAWAYHDGMSDQWYGLAKSRVQELFDQSLAVFNLCAASHPESLTFRPRGKLVYLETDPVLYQVRLAEGDQHALQFLASHDAHITYGENLGASDCPIPLPHFAWHKTRPPVVLDLWPFQETDTHGPFTTIATWHNRGKDLSFRGQSYQWSKHENFLALTDLPRRTSVQLELAVEIDNPVEHELFLRHGWLLSNPLTVSHDIDGYQRYISSSRGEFTVSKEAVVRTRSGWFSDRSVCFLAAGKPVVTQETGFSAYVPTGHGLFSFSSLNDILMAFEAITADYTKHARAAHDIAHEYFAAEKLLRKILSDIGI